MSDFKTYNEQGVEIKVTPADFELVQKDEKIHDVKFETKPTTFLKDAFKRFCKNKSSVVGAIIIGIILLLAIFVPIISPHDISLPDISKTFLPPKAFETGTGFWDGTQKYTNIIYDTENETPAEFKAGSVLEITGKREETINTTNQYAHGGTFVFVNDNLVQPGVSIYEQTDFLEHYYKINFKSGADQKIIISLNNQDNLLNYKLGTYRVILKSEELPNGFIVLKDWSKDYSELTINISQELAKANITDAIEGRIRLELLPSEDAISSYIGVTKITFVAGNNESIEIKELMEEISFDNANLAVMTSRTEAGYPKGYWQSNGKRLVHGAKVTYVDFTYDWYEHKLGLTTKQVGKSTVQDYIDNGWCNYDFKKGPSSFEVLDEKCPIVSVSEQKNSGESYVLTADVIVYREKGYAKMPTFLFGTDNFGYDIVKLCFAGLRVSLLLAICASAINITFGLIWGSISGYFGGNVDLIMERFCEILSGVPWTVLMTLAILLMGDDIVTFGLALCLTGWMGVAGRTRTQFYRFKGREYILASRTLGAKDGRLIFKHILPNAMGTIITSSVLMIPSTIFSETSLSYLGIGLQGSNSFGNILSRNQAYLSSHPALIIVPAVIISLIMISFNLFGNGLRDAFNPSLKGSE